MSKAIKLESLNKPIIDSEGNLTELGELIADDKALDLDAWVDARTFAEHPKRLLLIGISYEMVKPLHRVNVTTFARFRKREQKSYLKGDVLSPFPQLI